MTWWGGEPAFAPLPWPPKTLLNSLKRKTSELLRKWDYTIFVRCVRPLTSALCLTRCKWSRLSTGPTSSIWTLGSTLMLSSPRLSWTSLSTRLSSKSLPFTLNRVTTKLCKTCLTTKILTTRKITCSSLCSVRSRVKFGTCRWHLRWRSLVSLLPSALNLTTSSEDKEWLRNSVKSTS